MRQLQQTILQLDVQTQALHAAVDARWLELEHAGRIGRLDYIQHLVEQYGFEAPLEAALAYTRGLEAVVRDLPRRFRAGLLAQDLLTLGVSAGEITSVRHCMIDPFGSVVEALGWLYVHQRTTLRFESVVTKLVRHNPELEPATAYLSSSSGHVGASWQSFATALDDIAQSPAIVARIVDAAKDALHRATHWHARRESRQARSS